MKTLVFDIDGTLTTNISWERLNAAAGVSPEEDYALYSGFMRGDFDYVTWTQQLESLYKARGVLTREIAKSALLNFSLKDGVIEAITTCRNKGYSIMLLSGGFVTMAQAVGEMVGADSVFATSDIAFDNDGYFDHFLSGGEEGEAKAAILIEYCEKENIELTDCIPIGDSTNDIPLFNQTGNGVTYTWCKPEVQSAARHIIEDIRDFPALLDIL